MNLVTIENGRPVTDSLTVAETFGKRHADVIRSIESLECSEEFTERNFALSDYKDGSGRTLVKYIITEQGFAFLVMGYTGKEAARFKEMYIAEFDRMRDNLKEQSLNIETLSPQLQLLIQMEQRTMQLEATQLRQAEQIATIKETFLQRDDNWRNKINGLMKGASYRLGGNYQELRRQSYSMLEERARCDLDKRLRNLVERLEAQGATKTQLKNTSRMDVIEAEPRLKEIYTTIVKELSIGALT